MREDPQRRATTGAASGGQSSGTNSSRPGYDRDRDRDRGGSLFGLLMTANKARSNQPLLAHMVPRPYGGRRHNALDEEEEDDGSSVFLAATGGGTHSHLSQATQWRGNPAMSHMTSYGNAPGMAGLGPGSSLDPNR
jgi:hypothetical protein